MKLFPIITENYYYDHLFDSRENLSLINDFFIDRKSGKGLEVYLKKLAIEEEYDNSSRTYLVKDTKEIVAFFYFERRIVCSQN